MMYVVDDEYPQVILLGHSIGFVAGLICMMSPEFQDYLR